MLLILFSFWHFYGIFFLIGDLMNKINAKKSLGQNFLKDGHILQKISDSFLSCENDLIVEIGPGKGALTKYLVYKPSSLLCYELDWRMRDILLKYQSDRCQIIFDDFLQRDLKKDIKYSYEHIYFIANIPYYITTPIIEHILNSGILVSGMTFLIQKEVADRFCALPNSRFYGYFTVLLNHYFLMEKLFDVSPESFSPSPKVWSSVVKFVRKKDIYDLDVFSFQNFLKKAFSQKRKTLKNNLKEFDWEKIQAVLEKHMLSSSVRAEEIPYEIFVEIFMTLRK